MCGSACSWALPARSTFANALDSWVGWHRKQPCCSDVAVTSRNDKLALPTKTVKKLEGDEEDTLGKRRFWLRDHLRTEEWLRFPDNLMQEEHRLFVSHPYTGGLEVTVHAALSLSSCYYTCLTVSCSLSHYLFVWLSGSRVFTQRKLTLCCRRHLEAGWLHQGRPATHWHFFSRQIFLLYSDVSRVPLFRSWNTFLIFTCVKSWHDGIYLWNCVYLFDSNSKSNSCRAVGTSSTGIGL